MTTLPKTFDPAEAEGRLYAAWEASGAFAPEAALARDPDVEPFCMVIPPPNVTGSLHIGHALNTTLQDVLARFHRMRGRAVLWLPGTDHAGIATQMVVERQLAAAGEPGRRDMGREAFVQRVWDWKAQSGGAITRQLRRLGASCDWGRERFTLDEGLSAAVRRVFVQLHREGLLYRDKRLVNWDPALQTAISDLEVEPREVDGAYWRLAYKLEGGATYRHPTEHDDEGRPTAWETRDFIEVATTRPETMLGDTAVAVHPDDPRYADLVAAGARVTLPIVGRSMPLVADAYADPAKGTGAVKITPAHDFNDFEVGRRHGLEPINILDPQGRINAAAPAEYVGMDRFAARKAIVARAEAEGWLRGVDPTRHAVPYGDRSGVVIEPYLTDQWYVDAKTLAAPAIAAVETGATVFEPANWSKTYFEWMRNIEPWCVSRQLWWGHRIPAWYGPIKMEGSKLLEIPFLKSDLKCFVAETAEDALAAAREYYAQDVVLAEDSVDGIERYFQRPKPDALAIWQDDDVLDTWFSSALWPFSTLGWPDETDDLARFYPNDTLVTGFDIIFFWVARMMMMGLHFRGEVPFRRVVINGLVRDERGQKMSKSKGNVIDPLEIVDALGCDALRFSLAILSGSRDIKLSKSRIEGYRNFGTKLWNAARFCQMNGCARVAGFDPGAVAQPVNRWIRGEAVRAAAEVTAALEAARVDQAADALYRFIWNVLCDNYIEFAKPLLTGDDLAARDETRAVAAWALDQAMALLHPVSPYLTEELWAQTAGDLGRDTLLITAPWPDLPDAWIDGEAAAALDLVARVVGEGRSLRSELNVPPGARPELVVVDAEPAARAALEANAAAIMSTLRVSALRFGPAPAGAAPFVTEGAAFALPLAGVIDVGAERARLAKEVAAAGEDAARAGKKLANADFVARAKPEVVEETRARQAEAHAAHARLQAALARLEALG